jgi:hypothetical protein
MKSFARCDEQVRRIAAVHNPDRLDRGTSCLTLTVEQRTTESKADGCRYHSFVTSMLQFFDLAGSERVLVDPLR